MKKGNCFVIIDKNGKLLLEGIRLPIYWYKKLATHRALMFPGSSVKRINIQSLKDLIH